MNIKNTKLSISAFIATVFITSVSTNLNKFAIAEFLWNDAPYYENCNQYVREKKWNLAIENCNKAIKLDPKSANAYLLRGIIHYHQEQIELSLADYSRAIKSNPKLAIAFVHRSNIYLEQNKMQLALADTQAAIKLEPDLPLAHYTAGKLNIRLKNLDAAQRDFTEAKRLFSALEETNKVEDIDKILKELKILRKYQKIFSRLGYPGIFNRIINFTMKK